MALGYRTSTPTNIILSESKVESLENRAKYLGTTYFSKILSNKSSLVYKTIKNLSTVIKQDKRKRGLFINECINEAMKYESEILAFDNIPIYNFDYYLLSNPVNTDVLFGRLLQNTNDPNLLLNDYLNNESNSLHIYTDGSKNTDVISVGAACFCEKIDKQAMLSINKRASIFTAECAAINEALNIALDNKDKNIVIISDSLSAIESLNHPSFNAQTNPLIFEIRKKVHKFNNSDTYIKLLWVPSHQGLTGNENVDKLAKSATLIDPTIKHIPHTDLRNHIVQREKLASKMSIEELGLIKGVSYFEYFHNSFSKPWFYNKNMDRDLITTINRCRSGHYNLNESLHKIKVVPDSSCSCGYPVENLNHVIWQCPRFDQERKSLVSKLIHCGYQLPVDITEFLSKPNIKMMSYVNEFFNNCQIKI